MRLRYFLLGAVGGMIATAVVLALAMVILASRPLPEPPQAAANAAADVTVSLQEGYLGELATELARERDPMLQTVIADVQPGGRVDMTLGLRVTIFGQTLDLQARLINTVRIDDARLRLDVQTIDFAGLDIPLELLPQSLRTTLETMVANVNDRANRMLTPSGLVPVAVTTDHSGIAVSLRAR